MSRRDDLDVDHMLHAVRDNLWNADTNITAAERLIVERGGSTERTHENETTTALSKRRGKA